MSNKKSKRFEFDDDEMDAIEKAFPPKSREKFKPFAEKTIMREVYKKLKQNKK